MSGGHWDYVGFRIQDGMEDIAKDKEAKDIFSKFAISQI